MTDKSEIKTERPSSTSGSELERDVDPNDPSHKDAGQQQAEREREHPVGNAGDEK